jgi:hypothetical protein
MKKILNTLLLLACFAFASSFANTSSNDCNYKKIKQGYPTNKHDMQKAYLAPARTDTTGWDVFLKGSFIYWLPKQGGMEFATVRPTSTTAPEFTGYYSELDFNYKPGFKVEIGKALNHDNWDASVEYTWLYFSEKKRQNAVTDGELYPIWDDNAKSVSNYVEANWIVRYNMFDGLFGRACYLGTHLLLKPSFGLRGGWIDQRYNVNYNDETYTGISKSKIDAWMIGLKGQLSADFHLSSGVRFFSKGFVALLYEELKNSLDFSRYDPALFSHYLAAQTNKIIAPNMGINAGLGWGTYFCKNRMHIDFSASYDFEYFWNQNNLLSLLQFPFRTAHTAVNFMPKAPRDFLMHGLTINAKWDF